MTAMGAGWVAWLVSFALTRALVLLSRRHLDWLGDHDTTGPQKVHRIPVPRVGGVGVFGGLVAAALWLAAQADEAARWAALLVLAGLPAFLGGIAEDLTKRISPRRRLVLTALSALLAALAGGIVITRTDIPGLDTLVGSAAGAIALTLLAVSGVANAINLIDGFNGLASMCVTLMLAGLLVVAQQVGDPVVVTLALAGMGSMLGFFLWNYPSGRIFLGDGGAYFAGYYVAEVGLLLIVRNPQVSPLFPLLLVAYPVFETLFSMYRRRILKGLPIGRPDGVHLHSLVYRRLVHQVLPVDAVETQAARNSMTAPYLWALCALSVGLAVLGWQDSSWLALGLLCFGAVYVTVYWRIVRFRAPRWLCVRQ